MAKINEIEIKVTKAIITKVYIELEGDAPKYTVTGSLLTENGLKVSEFYFSTDAWTDDKKIEIPAILHAYSAEIFKLLTPIIYEKINGLFTMLPEKATK